MEDPAESFVKLRDFVDCVNAGALKAFSRDKVLQGFSDDMAAAAKRVLKIGKVWYAHLF